MIWRKNLGLAVAVFIIAATAALLAGRDHIFSVGPHTFIDFGKLTRSSSSYLVAPDGFTPSPSDAEAPVLGLAVEKLREKWVAMMERQDGVEKIAESPDGLQIDYVRRSKYLRIPDVITVRFIPLPSDPETGHYATLAVYSRSTYSSSDAQRSRVDAWLNRL